jgi:hypothetical protein
MTRTAGSALERTVIIFQHGESEVSAVVGFASR